MTLCQLVNTYGNIIINYTKKIKETKIKRKGFSKY